jgi:tetratricopeptide (TPR) repeat protein
VARSEGVSRAGPSGRPGRGRRLASGVGRPGVEASRSRPGLGGSAGKSRRSSAAPTRGRTSVGPGGQSRTGQRAAQRVSAGPGRPMKGRRKRPSDEEPRQAEKRRAEKTPTKGRPRTKAHEARRRVGTPRKWGSVARHGAHEVVGSSAEQGVSGQSRSRGHPRTRQDLASSADGRDRRRPGGAAAAEPRPDREEQWILESIEEGHRGDGPSTRQTRANRSSRSRSSDEVVLPPEIRAEVQRFVGRPTANDLLRRLERATVAYKRDRYEEAYRTTKALAALVPESPSVRELHGLVCYRLGRWTEAARHLEAARELGGGDPSQIPVIMDCRRALSQHRKVEALFDELRASSPAADVLSEGRLVLAGQRADRGDIDGAIELLVTSGAGRNLRHPRERHLRQWYVLADLYERAGDLPRARELFARVAEADPALADAPRRMAELGRSIRPARAIRRGARAASRRRSRP